MSGHNDDVFTYLLIDNGLLQEESAGYAESDSNSRPRWLEPIYAERALEVSPFLIDIESAYESGDLDQVMGYLNARRPALHLSIIETTLPLKQIGEHLRQFIFIVDPEDKQFTLRYADCAVLLPLSSLLTESQWAAMRGRIRRWGIHVRSGAILQLPPAKTDAYASTPLSLNREQLAAIDEASEPDHLIAKVDMMRHGGALPGDAVKRHAWATSARQVWQASGNSNPLFLLFLTESALLTQGDILKNETVHHYLAMDEVSLFRKKLQELEIE